MDKLAVTVQNLTTRGLYIDRDPNWDDEVLTIHDKPQTEIYLLTQSSSTLVGVADPAATEMGVIFATSKDYDNGRSGFFQLTIGQDKDGRLGVTDGGPNGSPLVKYVVLDREPLSMTMRFSDDYKSPLAITVKNSSSSEIRIGGDPNWDDQHLTVDGKREKHTFPLAPAESAVLGIEAEYNEMGVIFNCKSAEGGGDDAFYQLTIGPDDDTNNQDVTDSYIYGKPAVKYTLHDQEPMSMTMLFVDA